MTVSSRPAGPDGAAVLPSPPRTTRARSALAGLVGSGALVLGFGLVHVFVPAVPFPPATIAQALVRAPPGSVESFFIDLLGHWAERLAMLGTALGFVLSGALLGLAIPPLSRRPGSEPVAGAVSFLALWAGTAAIYPHPSPPALSRWPFAAATLPLFAAAGALGGLVHRRLFIPEQGPVRAPPSAVDRSRRYFLAALGMGGAGVLLGVSNLSALVRPRPDPGDRLLRVSGLVPASAPPPDPAFDRISGLSSRVTPLGEFYVVDESLIDPDIDPATWRLSVGGLVDRPFRLSYQQLKGLPLVERYQTLECISNKVGGDLISTARWVGVPLRHILERAGVRPGVVEVVFRAAGGYSDSLPIDQAMDETTLIAIGMNGHVLPRAHGFPARLLSVGTYGMKNPKWLTSIEAVDHPYVGFWEGRGWAAQTPVKTFSRFDTPGSGAGVGPSVAVGGVAFAGDRGVSRVDVSTDGGRSWRQAQVEAALSPYTWRRWRFRWRPPGPGQHGLIVRATDGGGRLQVRSVMDPYPSGATGYDAIVVRR